MLPFGNPSRIKLSNCIKMEVSYIGSIPTDIKPSNGCTIKPVENIWRRSVSEDKLPRMLLTLNPSGIQLRNIKSSEIMEFKCSDIGHFCALHPNMERIFSWLHAQNGDRNQLWVHAIFTSSAVHSYYLARHLDEYFKVNSEADDLIKENLLK
ncbi:unnamed protein product [Dimorphilus gyrociliatus]|uniref:PID domain-containing protein n=1 Tax=Dimorphilus gyrociliatus TaxID=2664684 RepID=A0A7I8W9V2_9ANNE|nr:unnamed protein product [Dimorphilus gyrociliatus]